MYYCPHILEKKVVTVTRDAYNRTTGESVSWVRLGACRCDDNTTFKFVDNNGHADGPAYHIVANKCDVKAGDTVRALDGEEVRGEGEVSKVIKTNYLNYVSIYV